MKPDPITRYLRALKWELWLRGLADQNTLAEVENHLRDAADQNARQGMSLPEAQQQAVDRFGSPRWLAGRFDQERNGRMQKILLALALIAGLLLAYIDSRPTWDDTGITVFALLLASGMLGLAGFRRPWLLGLAVGIWIPLWEGVSRTNFGALAALAFAFAGAYAGWAAHQLLRKLLRPA